jgi:hypothetical protein
MSDTHETQHFIDTTHMQPELAEVLREEPVAMIAVPVDIKGPVQTRKIPTESGGFSTFVVPVAPAGAIKILDADPRRAHAILIVADVAGASRGISIGGKQSEAAEDVGFNIPLYGTGVSTAYVHPEVTITSKGELWAIANGTSCKVSVLNEQWAL